MPATRLCTKNTWPPRSELLHDRFADHPLAETREHDLDRLAVQGRRLDDREVPDAGKRHVERARDRRCREGEHVHELFEFLDPLLVLDAELVLLVHDEEAQVLENDVPLEKPVRADHHVHGPVLQALERLLLFGLGPEPGEHVHADGEGRDALRKRAKMLVRQQRRGHEHRDLHAVLHGLERGPERNLRFAVPHVAAHQPVHGPRPLHVGQDVFDGLLLVRCLLEGEGSLELAVEIVRRGEGRAALGLAGGVDGHKLLRHREDVLLHFFLGPGPGGRAQAVELRGRAFDADVLLHFIEAVKRHV